LTEWDISFDINVDVLSRFLSFLSDINTDIPIIFYRDRIVIRQKSSDSISFTEIEIEVADVMNYRPGLPEGKEAKDSDHKLVLIDGGELADEISSYAKGEDLINVKIDSKRLKKVEFACNEFKTWVALLVVPDFVSKLDVTTRKIRENRSNSAFKGASMILEPESFNKICALGGKKKDIEIVLEANKKGLLVYTSDKDSGRSFTIDYEPDFVGVAGEFDSSFTDTYSGSDDNDDESYDDRELDNDEIGNEIANDVGNDEVGSVPADNEVNNETNDDTVRDDNVDVSWGIPIQKVSDKDDKSNKRKGKNKDKEDKEDKEEKDNSSAGKYTSVRAGKSKFLSFEINGDRTITSTMKKEYICILSKLKAQGPITIEMRNNAPLILEQINSGMWKVILTIAPIIEDENL